MNPFSHTDSTQAGLAQSNPSLDPSFAEESFNQDLAEVDLPYQEAASNALPFNFDQVDLDQEALSPFNLETYLDQEVYPI